MRLEQEAAPVIESFDTPDLTDGKTLLGELS
jgi:hypothetical protein